MKYKPTDIEPYDIFKKTGTRSIEYDCKEFSLSYTTSGNILPKTVMKLVKDHIENRLTRMKEKLSIFDSNEKKDTKSNSKYYYTDGLEVEINEELRIYKFPGEYITMPGMVAQRCYLLDPNIQLCIPTVDRFDNEIGIIKINHADPNKILLASIDDCIKDVNIIYKAISNAKITKE